MFLYINFFWSIWVLFLFYFVTGFAFINEEFLIFCTFFFVLFLLYFFVRDGFNYYLLSVNAIIFSKFYYLFELNWFLNTLLNDFLVFLSFCYKRLLFLLFYLKSFFFYRPYTFIFSVFFNFISFLYYKFLFYFYSVGANYLTFNLSFFNNYFKHLYPTTFTKLFFYSKFSF